MTRPTYVRLRDELTDCHSRLAEAAKIIDGAGLHWSAAMFTAASEQAGQVAAAAREDEPVIVANVIEEKKL